MPQAKWTASVPLPPSGHPCPSCTGCGVIEALRQSGDGELRLPLRLGAASLCSGRHVRRMNVVPANTGKSGYTASLITREGIDALLQFLPYFSSKRPSFGSEASIHDGRVEPSVLGETSEEFWKACYKHNFVQDFDWGEWSQSRQPLISRGEGIEDLDLADIGRLITTHIRGDRFCDGHLLEVMRSGQMARILERLSVLRRSGDVR